MYSPLPFRWVPGDGKRHATNWPAADGTITDALCGERITAAFDEIAWFWSTCPGCNEAAHALASTPMPPAETDRAAP